MTPWYDRPINRWVYGVAVPLAVLAMIAVAYLLTAGIGWWVG
jgi:carbohydrate-binding DOMON domain-containing protein